MQVPETKYARTVDGLHIAYQVLGEGPVDAVFAHGEISNVDRSWDVPEVASFLRRIASFSRLLAFDRRGNGLSDRDIGGATFEAGMDDIRAVMDAAGSQRALLLGHQDGGMLSMLFAASFPERTLGLVLFNTSARQTSTYDYAWGWGEQEWDEYLRQLDESWGTLESARQHLAWMEPDHPLDDETVERFARLLRAAGSPGDVVKLESVIRHADVRAVLPTIHVPTIVIATRNDVEPYESGTYLAGLIPGAEFVSIPSRSYTPFFSAQDAYVEQVERFAKRVQAAERELDRVLATVLFTDIVDSTAQSAAMGDRAWSEVRDRHDQLVRSSIARFRGREIKTMGDGFLATFDGPARGVRCAQAVVEGVRPLGIEVRAGLHTGEVEFVGDDVAGLGVAIGARVGAKASASEVLVSQTVKDLVAGSGLVFEDAGDHELKGVPDHWRLYRVAD